MDFRKVFDSIPEAFDRWRPRYCPELFADLTAYAGLAPGKAALEVGPGTGQATEPILKTGCDYLAIELGENFAGFMNSKYGGYDNYQLVCDDFETHDFGDKQFDLVYSAAAFQWIPEAIGYPKAFELLKPNGAFAMFMTRANRLPSGAYTEETLYHKIQAVYAEHFHPETEYTCQLDYDARGKYGFIDLECREYLKLRTFTADEYVAYSGTHSDHLTLKEPHRTGLYEGIRQAILDAGDQITIYDKIVMYLARKP